MYQEEEPRKYFSSPCQAPLLIFPPASSSSIFLFVFILFLVFLIPPFFTLARRRKGSKWRIKSTRRVRYRTAFTDLWSLGSGATVSPIFRRYRHFPPLTCLTCRWLLKHFQIIKNWETSGKTCFFNKKSVTVERASRQRRNSCGTSAPFHHSRIFLIAQSVASKINCDPRSTRIIRIVSGLFVFINCSLIDCTKCLSELGFV